MSRLSLDQHSPISNSVCDKGGGERRTSNRHPHRAHSLTLAADLLSHDCVPLLPFPVQTPFLHTRRDLDLLLIGNENVSPPPRNGRWTSSRSKRERNGAQIYPRVSFCHKDAKVTAVPPLFPPLTAVLSFLCCHRLAIVVFVVRLCSTF